VLFTISERFALSSVLPVQGDITMLKDLRKLKEDLAISEEDRKEVQFFNEYECPECKNKNAFPAPVKCGKCDVWMRPTGQIGCSNWEFTKEVLVPDYLKALITATLKKMNDDKTLEEKHISLYEKFMEEKNAANQS
jgi:hypothetical protein